MQSSFVIVYEWYSLKVCIEVLLHNVRCHDVIVIIWLLLEHCKCVINVCITEFLVVIIMLLCSVLSVIVDVMYEWYCVMVCY